MNFTLRQRIFIIIGIVAGVVLAIVLFIMFVNAPDDNTPYIDPNVIDSNSGPKVNILKIDEQEVFVPQQPVGEVYVKNLSRMFTERFNTYSNQNDNVHIEEVSSLVTDKMARWIAKQGEIQSPDYAGVTTQVLSMSLLNFDETLGTSQVAISARQMIMTADPDGSGRVIQKELIKDAVVDLAYENGEWKVDGLWWED